MNKSETITEIAKALSKFQSEVSDPERTKENAYFAVDEKRPTRCR